MMGYVKTLAAAAALALSGAAASSTTIGVGQSVDFRIDLSAEGAVTASRYGVACSVLTVCSSGGGALLSLGESLRFAVGSIRGADDLFSTVFTATASNVDVFSAPIGTTLSFAASVDEVFLRVTALDAPITVTGAQLSDFSPSFVVYNGVELAAAPVPLPAGGALLLAALGLSAAVGMRRKRV